MATNKDTAALARRDLLLGLGIGIGALAVPAVAIRPAKAQDDADIEIIVIGSPDNPSGGLGSPEDMRLVMKGIALDAALTLQAGGAVLIGIAGLIFVFGGPLSAGLIASGVVLGGIGLAIEWMLWQLAWDPPQLVYQIPAHIKPWSIQVPPPYQGALPSAEKAIRAANVGGPVVRGMIDSLERLQGAEAAGDALWADRHQLGLGLQTALFASRALQLATSLVAVANGPLGTVKVSSRRVAQARTYFADPANAAPVRSLMADAGLTVEQIDHAFAALAAIDPTQIKGQSLKAVLLDMAKGLRTSSDRFVAAW